ncbi:MAG: TRAP transporter small permease subunit [Synergistaceae bacterium]|jgi:TRAP-type C4-dicarboxylate transport system permease small subunit|nr:TRAP transporter small permease subunit [Synergistaceae bacterium]
MNDAAEQPFVDRIINSKANRMCVLLQKIIMIVSTVIMLALLASVVLFRYVLHADIYGYDEFLLSSAFWMYFIGATYAMYEGTHVKADIVGMFLPLKKRLRLKLTAGVINIAVSAVLTVLAFNLAERAVETWQVSAVWDIPFLIYQLPIFIGFLLMTFYLTLETLKDFQKLKSANSKGGN